MTNVLMSRTDALMCDAVDLRVELVANFFDVQVLLSLTLCASYELFASFG